jgi:predicted esterase YcpF (UPF0227 family)
MASTVVYIHGFNSSPASFKAALLQRELARRAPGVQFIAPALPPSPAAAADLLEGIAHDEPHAVLIGSSLGGYYATWLAERFALRTVLLNPAVRPYDLLARAVGRQRNLYTGEEYDFTADHVRELRALEVERITSERYLLLVGTADEVLDYRHAVERYRGAQQVLIAGGDHGLGDFGGHLDTVLEFTGAPAPLPVTQPQL